MAPPTEVRLFQEDDASVPLLCWLDSLPRKVQNKCIVRVERLAERGHELRRPEAALLRDGIYELRVRYGRVNYRMLYFFHENAAVVSHGITKESKVPDKEIDLVLRRRGDFSLHPERHTYIYEGEEL